MRVNVRYEEKEKKNVEGHVDVSFEAIKSSHANQSTCIGSLTNTTIVCKSRCRRKKNERERERKMIFNQTAAKQLQQKKKREYQDIDCMVGSRLTTEQQ